MLFVSLLRKAGTGGSNWVFGVFNKCPLKTEAPPRPRGTGDTELHGLHLWLEGSPRRGL